MPVTITQGTTTGIATDLVGTNHYQTIKLDIGTTGVSNLFSGTLPEVSNVAKGTVSVVQTGTINQVGTIPGIGTMTNLGSVTNIGTMKEAGTVTGVGVLTTVTTVSNLTNGSINILTGTIQSSGTTTGVGTVTNLGSVTNAGTVKEVTTVPTVTTVSNLTNGSINILTGTTTLVSTVTTVSNLTNGSVNLLTGTVNRTSNVGTIESGTVQINPVPVPSVLTFGTLGTAGGSFFATISAASGAGTRHFISGVNIVMHSGTADVRVLAGTVIQGTGVITAGQFPAGGGISDRMNPVFATGTNSEITYHFVGAGTAFITVKYWKGT